MTLRAADPHEETHATDTARPAAAAAAADALDDTLPVALKRDFILLLLQSPHRLYLYWTFARDPRITLREAFGELAADYRPAVRLINVESGEEYLLDATNERAQWFEVYPRHVYRAEVGFHAAGRPFVRLLASNTVTTPPDGASHLTAEEPEFQVEAGEFARLLGGAGYERYARGDAGGAGEQLKGGVTPLMPEQPGAGGRLSREAADEYPHR